MESRHRLPFAAISGTSVPRPVPAARRAPVSAGVPMVADSPMRRGCTPAIRERRSIRQSVCPPRSPRRRECTSSITTKCRSPKSFGIAACRCRRSASSDSGVICKMPDGCFISRALCVWPTSPCQCHTGIPAVAQSGVSRSNWSLMSAFNGPM